MVRDVTARKVNAKRSIANVTMQEYPVELLANATTALTVYALTTRL
jgi:hypothetical protein